jgi:cell division septation protein DedD
MPIDAARTAPRFFVQLGAFPDEASAREIFNQLEAEGFAPTLAEPDEQFEIYRIFIGPYPDEAAAEDVAEKLNAIDFHCFVIEQP